MPAEKPNKARSNGNTNLPLIATILPVILLALYLGFIREPVSTQPKDKVGVKKFEQLRLQYAAACPRHSFDSRIFSTDPLIIYLKGFIGASERDYIIQLAEPEYDQSPVSSGLTEDGQHIHALDPSHRSSKTAFLYNDPVIDCIRGRAAEFQSHTPRNRVEDLQVVKYVLNDHFNAHWDWTLGEPNPRVSTFFVYLACDSGEDDGAKCGEGATLFPDYNTTFAADWCDVIDCEPAGHRRAAFKPLVGNAVFWSNVHPNGTYHTGTLHAGMPLKSGRKVGLNIWTHATEFLYPEVYLGGDK